VAVAFDAGSESHTGTTGSVSEASFTWSHDPVGVPRGVLVFVQQNFFGDATDIITSVTYAGVNVPAVAGGAAADTATETMLVKTFFLGTSVPTNDPATVVVNRVNNTTVLYAVCITVTALNDTGLSPTVLLQENAAVSEQNVDDGSPGTNSLRFAAVGTGLAAPPAAGANSTAVHSIDYGANGVAVVRETTAGQGSRPVGCSSGTSDDLAAVHLAVKEVVTAALLKPAQMKIEQFVPVHFPNRW
jgi:hypothetical protein